MNKRIYQINDTRAEPSLVADLRRIFEALPPSETDEAVSRRLHAMTQRVLADEEARRQRLAG